MNCEEIVRMVVGDSELDNIGNIKNFDGACEAEIKNNVFLELNTIRIVEIINRPLRLEPENTFIRVKDKANNVVFFTKS